MSSKRRKLVVIISIISAFSILFGTVVVAAAWSEGGISELWNSLTNKDGVVKYEKPSVGEIAQDGAYPDEVKSNSSANAREKEWYEYITYSKTPIGEVKDGNQKIVFYDPYDYNYGMIMEISNTKSDSYIHDGYATANEISVSYSVSQSHSWSSSLSVDLGFEKSFETKVEASVGASAFGAEASATVGTSVGMKFSQNVGVSHIQSGSNDSSEATNLTFNAVHFNANGSPYNWRIVKYTVHLPLYCEVQKLVDGKWVVTDSTYCLLATVRGTCREWIENGVAFVEDWRTGEPVQVENFWKKFFTKEALIDAYVNQMIPKN